jgi:hypothetical protein
VIGVVFLGSVLSRINERNNLKKFRMLRLQLAEEEINKLEQKNTDSSSDGHFSGR